MEIFRPVKNLLRYGSTNLMPQVDPDVMEPIFKRCLQQLRSFHSPLDHLSLQKGMKENLRFQYSSKQADSILFYGTIYAREPRKSFGGVDVFSFMAVTMLEVDKQGELFDAIQNIVEEAGIEKVISSGMPGIQTEDTERLRKIQGFRLPQQLLTLHAYRCSDL